MSKKDIKISQEDAFKIAQALFAPNEWIDIEAYHMCTYKRSIKSLQIFTLHSQVYESFDFYFDLTVTKHGVEQLEFRAQHPVGQNGMDHWGACKVIEELQILK